MIVRMKLIIQNVWKWSPFSMASNCIMKEVFLFFLCSDIKKEISTKWILKYRHSSDNHVSILAKIGNALLSPHWDVFTRMKNPMKCSFIGSISHPFCFPYPKEQRFWVCLASQDLVNHHTIHSGVSATQTWHTLNIVQNGRSLLCILGFFHNITQWESHKVSSIYWILIHSVFLIYFGKKCPWRHEKKNVTGHKFHRVFF